MLENSLVVGAADEYERRYGEPSEYELQQSRSARQMFIEDLLKGRTAIGDYGSSWSWYNLWEDCECTIEIDWQESLQMWLNGQLTEYAVEVHKAAAKCADAAGLGEL